MPYILDTNALGDLWRFGQECILGRRLAAIPNPAVNLRVTIITFQEMLAGRIKDLSVDPKIKGLQPLHVRYGLLAETYRRLYEYYPPFPFDEAAQDVFESISKAVRTHALSNDCKIASIAVVQNCTVITANTKDFVRIQSVIPVRYEDWTAAPMV